MNDLSSRQFVTVLLLRDSVLLERICQFESDLLLLSLIVVVFVTLFFVVLFLKDSLF